jgi:hypothetical protein
MTYRDITGILAYFPPQYTPVLCALYCEAHNIHYNLHARRVTE